MEQVGEKEDEKTEMVLMSMTADRAVGKQGKDWHRKWKNRITSKGWTEGVEHMRYWRKKVSKGQSLRFTRRPG